MEIEFFSDDLMPSRTDERESGSLVKKKKLFRLFWIEKRSSFKQVFHPLTVTFRLL